MFTKEFAELNGFSFKHYPDGWYWVKINPDDSLYQVSEDGNLIQFYDGDVFDITFDQLVSTLSK